MISEILMFPMKSMIRIYSFKVLVFPQMSDDSDFTFIFKDEDLVVYLGLLETTYFAHD